MALPPHFGDPLAVGDLMVDIGADMGGEGGILDPEHQLEIEEQAAHVEIGRTDMDGVVDDVELGVELGRLIFVDLDSFPQQPGSSEEHTSELQSLMRNSYAVCCLNKK